MMHAANQNEGPIQEVPHPPFWKQVLIIASAATLFAIVIGLPVRIDGEPIISGSPVGWVVVSGIAWVGFGIAALRLRRRGRRVPDVMLTGMVSGAGMVPVLFAAGSLVSGALPARSALSYGVAFLAAAAVLGAGSGLNARLLRRRS